MLLGKALAILSTLKGAAAATVIAAAAVGTGVAATNHDVQTAVNTAVETVTGKASAQPAVVAARNDADLAAFLRQGITFNGQVAAAA